MNQSILIISKGVPYGGESLFHALRFAISLREQDVCDVRLKLFLLSDAVTVALKGQRPVEGYNLRDMLEILREQGVEIKICKTCCEARGVSEDLLVSGCQIGTLSDLTQWTLEADKVLTF